MSLPPKDTSSNKVLNASFTIGSEGAGASNAINVAVQYEWASGQEVNRRVTCFCYLSTDAEGDNLAAAPSGGIAIGTNGVAIETLADQGFWLVSNASGAVDIDITDAGAKTLYLVVVLPSGDLVASDAITFA